MFHGRIATVYTSLADTWATLTTVAGLGREELVGLNPHLEDVEEIEPGIPIDIPAEARAELFARAAEMRLTGVSAYEVAREELLLNVAENPRPGKDNPRIQLYHASTSSGAAPDEVAWCSSFVNFCTERAGHAGTDSKASRSWLKWGSPVERDDWQQSDVIVFKRGGSSWKGHVGFLVDWLGDRPKVLGGNQDDRLSIATPYPFSAILGVRRQSANEPS